MYEHVGPRPRKRNRLLWRLTKGAGLCAVMVMLLLLFLGLAGGGLRIGLRFPGPVRAWLEQPVEVNTAPVRDAVGKSMPERSKSAAHDDRRGGNFFGMGSSQDEVLRVQGRPTRVSGSTWYYGNSEVRFVGGRVVAWQSSDDRPLHTGP